MNNPKRTGEISPAYQNAIAVTAEHYKTMTALVAAVLSSCGASEFFTQDMEDMGGAR